MALLPDRAELRHMHIFDRDISVTHRSDGVFTSTITANWTINGTPHGGYLMAMLANAVLQSCEKSGSPIITANFISRSEPGDAEIHVEAVAKSKQFERYECRLVQGGLERIRCLMTFSQENGSASLKRYERSEPCIAAVDECVPMPEMPNYSLYKRMDLRLDPSCAGWLTGSVSPDSAIKGWIRFREDRPFDLVAAILMSDAFPPAVLPSHGMVSWIPTIEFSLNVRKCAPTTWLKCLFRTSFVDNGIFDEDGEMWDERGRLVGISRQYAQMRLP